MKILICTSESGMNAGGLALHCSQLKEIFKELGHSVEVEILLNPDDINVLDGGYDSELGNKIRSSYKLNIMIQKYKDVDICVSCGAGRTSYFAMLFCKANKKPLYIVLCGSEVNLSFEKAELAFYNKESFVYASKIIGLSEELNNNARLLSSNGSCKYYVIPNICEISNGDNSIDISKKNLIYATGASFLGEKKGIANLLYAFADLIKKRSQDKLYLFGKIDEDIMSQYESLIEMNGLNNNVEFFGYVDRDSFHKKMEEVDVYIQASPFEGFGNAVAEALALGKDILISNTGYIAESIIDKFPNHIFESLEPEAISKKISEYAEKTYKKNESQTIRDLLEKLLSKEKIVSAWGNVLDSSPSCVKCMDEHTCISVMFHDVFDSYTGIDYAVEGFEKLVQKAYEKGYKLCSAKEYFGSLDKSNLIVCTFDDGYENVYKNAFPLMDKYGFSATVYICPDLIGQDNSWNHKDSVNRRHLSHEMIADLVNNNWEIGSHGLSHINMLRLSEHELDKCLELSKEQLKRYGVINSYCYPYGSFNEFVKKKVAKYYKNAFSVSIGGPNYEFDMYQITRLTPEELVDRLELTT